MQFRVILLGGVSYSSVDMQSVYSTASADWAKERWVYVFPKALCEVKCKQPRLGFELRLPTSFPMVIILWSQTCKYHIVFHKISQEREFWIIFHNFHQKAKSSFNQINYFQLSLIYCTNYEGRGSLKHATLTDNILCFLQQMWCVQQYLKKRRYLISQWIYKMFHWTREIKIKRILQ